MADDENKAPETPYKQILKPTFIMGATSIINSLLAVARIKFIALILGPAGVGLVGIYQTLGSLVYTFCGMGIWESGVRQIAASGSDQQKIARTILTVRRLTMFSGIIGCCLLFLFRDQCGELTFKNLKHGKDIAVLSSAIFFMALYAGQVALIQGLRRIADLARVQVLGAFIGTVTSVPIIYFLGERGVAYYFLMVSAGGTVASWWYSRKIRTAAVTLNLKEMLPVAGPLLKLGVALMLGFFMSLCTTYCLRVMALRYNGLDAAGMFHASTTLSTVYVGVILNAMMTDFYPRLSGAADDHEQCRYLINKQIEVGLLLAFPGIMAVMTFAPLVITMFYSPKFMPAVDILRWQILGVLLQVMYYPMGIMLRAKGNGPLFLLTELFSALAQLSLAATCLHYFGLPGMGMGFFGMTVLYSLLIYRIDKRKYAFSFTVQNLKMVWGFALAIGVVFATPYFLPPSASLTINICTTLVAAASSIAIVLRKTDIMLPGFVLKLKARLGLEVK